MIKKSEKSEMLNEIENNDSLSSIGLVKQIEDIQGLSENEDIKVMEDYTTSVTTNRINLQYYLSFPK